MKQQRMIIRQATLLIVLALAGCASPTTELYNDAMSSYRKNNLQEALPKFERLAAQKTDAESYAWLAETYRRLGKNIEALTNARTSLGLDPCNSFAHTVVADVSNPMYGTWERSSSDTTWTHLQRAVDCNPRDGNAWLSFCVEAMKNKDTLIVQRALRGMVTSGFLTRPALALGRWMLRALPPDAVLITNGDMDTFPLWAVQETEGFRKDVSVVNRSLLNTEQYQAYVRDIIHIPIDLPGAAGSQPDTLLPADRVFRMWMNGKSDGSLAHPVAVACTVEQAWYDAYKGEFHFCGPFLIWSRDAASGPSAALLAKASLEGVKPAEFLGSFVSEQDRSPVRFLTSNGLVQPIIWTAIMNSTLSMRGGDLVEGERWLDWAEEVDTKAAFGRSLTDKINELKKELKQRGN
jgi:tetratricopeptide (TPR) repeat protein